MTEHFTPWHFFSVRIAVRRTLRALAMRPRTAISAALVFLSGGSLSVACGGDPKVVTSSTECAIGTEGCSCTRGGACDPNLACTQGVCLYPGNGGAGGGAGSTSTGGGPSAGGSPSSSGAAPGIDGGALADGGGKPSIDPVSLCQPFCSAPRAKCNLPAIDEAACMTDCQTRAGKVSTQCAGLWEAAFTCASSGDAWTCGDGSATRTGCTAEAQAYDTCVSHVTPAGTGGAGPTPGCTSDSDCGARSICSGGTCEHVECTSDSDCGSCSRCSDHSCRDCGSGPYGCYC